MDPHLIVDFERKLLFAGILDRQGRYLPCSFDIEGMSARYWPSEILVGADYLDRIDDDLRDTVNRLFVDQRDEIFLPWRELNWFRHWVDKQDGDIALRSPLKMLSALYEDKSPGNTLSRLGVLLIGFLLEPLIRTVCEWGFSPREMHVIAVVPPFLTRRAQLLLRKVFKSSGFRKIILLDRSLALAMHAFWLKGISDVITVHAGAENLLVARVAVEITDNEIHFRLFKSRTLRGRGWDDFIALLSPALKDWDSGNSGESSTSSRLGESVLQLLTGIGTREAFNAPDRKTSYGSLMDVLHGELGKKIQRDWFNGLKAVIEEFGGNEPGLMCSGLIFTLPGMEDLLMGSLKGLSATRLHSDARPLERSVQGVRTSLNWLQDDPKRRISAHKHGSIRVATSDGGTLEVVPASLLDLRPGETRTLRQRLNLTCATGTAGKALLAIDLLWGCDNDPEYNSTLCLWTQDFRVMDLPSEKVMDVMFELKGKSIVPWLSGNVTLKLGNRETKKKLEFTSVTQVLSVNMVPS
jgi:hypothetical protein